MKVIEYITEEVRRQGFDVSKPDGIERVGWMIEAWIVCCNLSEPIEPYQIILLGKLTEHVVNRSGLRCVPVRVGMNPCPDWQHVPRLLEQLCENQQSLSPIEFYREFELIHPFMDGNGRVGKILLNWRNGTLIDPIFPPDDLFGERIANP